MAQASIFGRKKGFLEGGFLDKYGRQKNYLIYYIDRHGVHRLINTIYFTAFSIKNYGTRGNNANKAALFDSFNAMSQPVNRYASLKEMKPHSPYSYTALGLCL